METHVLVGMIQIKMVAGDSMIKTSKHPNFVVYVEEAY